MALAMKFKWLVLPIALALCACSPALDAGPACPAAHARYELRGAPGAQMTLVRAPHALNAYSDLVARVEFQDETYWFAFTSSLGFSRNYIGRTEDPFEAARREDAGEDIGEEHREPEYDGSEYVGFDSNFDVIPEVPRAESQAPAHILANGIASAIWYSEPRRELPLGLWSLTSCVGQLAPSADR